MPVDPSAWSGILGGLRTPRDVVDLNLVSGFDDQTMAAPFQAESADRRRWWVKPLNNPHSPRVPATEIIVGQAGRLIDAPVCESSVVRIPDELAGGEYARGTLLEAGLASGSLDVPGVTEIRHLRNRERDDNRRRHAGVFALHDWCWGEDDQWLSAYAEDDRTYSHDHGSFLPGGPLWTVDTLKASVDTPHPQRRTDSGLDPIALRGYADKLDRLTRGQLREILMAVPAEWPVTQDELETVGWFLERRAPQVAERLRKLEAKLTKGGSG